ncbi:hypothetical protein C6P40_002740 [Pichia californica]|uniref:CBM21 domain-containing protein n=1 Tax=Pichia californica TaxID=460514 RepID=A0A9P6WNP5_9ASCO|nr:hypothetical protein C6P40_002740 [[Candida] californica]
MPYVPSPRKRKTSVDSQINEKKTPIPKYSTESSTNISNNNLITNIENQISEDSNISTKNTINTNITSFSSNNNNNNNNNDKEEDENNIINTSISSDEDNLPLSLSFIRRPSRSSSMNVDFDRIMKQNTLMNSRSFETLADNNLLSNDDINTNDTIKNSSTSINNIIDEPSSPLSPLYSYNSSNVNINSDDNIVHIDNIGNNNNNYSYPLIRKKSGELVKSSLKLNGMFKSSGAISLPSTPTYKQVHFGNNIAIKYFDQKDKPNSISADNSPYNSELDDDISENEIDTSVYSDDDDNNNDDDDDGDDSYNENGVEYFGFSNGNDSNNNLNKTKNLYEKLFKASKNLVQLETPINLEKFKYLMKNWNLDTSQFKSISYRDQIDCELPVFLERCFLNLDKTLIIGQIAVKNLSFDKIVEIRYSFDNWFTIINVNAKYTSDIPRILKKSGYDRFIFQLSTPLLFSNYLSSSSNFYNSNPNFEFCIKYSAGGQDFWDNNHSKNYRLNFIHENSDNNKNLKTSPTPSKIRPFDDSYFSLKKSTNNNSINDNKNRILEALERENGGKIHSIPKSGALKTNQSFATLNHGSTLKKSRSFDKRSNIKSLISSPEFQIKNTDSSVPNDSCIIDLNYHTKTGLRNNFMDKDSTQLPSSNTKLKNDNENILAKLKELKIDPLQSVELPKCITTKSQNIISGNNIINNCISNKSNLENLKMGTSNKIHETSTLNKNTNKNINIDKGNGTGSDINTDMNTNTNSNTNAKTNTTGNRIGFPIQGMNGVDSATYKDLLEKYCFFQGPSTVSSFLAEEHDSTRNPLYDDKFY